MASKIGPFLKILEQKTATGKFASKISVYCGIGGKSPVTHFIFFFILICKQSDFLYFMCALSFEKEMKR